ncbi:MAG: InlB B-repeat-containing protein [Spirochaetaceae bacterium]|nr:InlB B-repeat-containing protein [Spirochaetaceae bacterium]
MFEKRIAIPTKIWYEAAVAETGNTDGFEEKEITAENGEKKTVYFTESKDAINRKENGLIIGEGYKLAASYLINGSEVTQNPPVPVFTREHYTSAGWQDINGESVDPTSDDYDVPGDIQLYQQWNANTFTVTFDLNGKSGTAPNSLSEVNEALSAEGGLKKAGKDMLPPAAATVTESDLIYEFVNWADAEVGGNVINTSSPLFPKDESGAVVTLYAQWRVKGVSQYVFNYNGVNGGADGKVQTWIVPLDGVYKIEVWGAGGDGTAGVGGKGGYVGGDINLTEGTPLYIYVGGKGAPSNGVGGANPQAGGWNGGGKSSGSQYSGGSTGGGGHGATDIRTATGNWDNEASLASRIIVAGGGGGGAGGTGYGGISGNGGLGIAAGGNGLTKDKTNPIATAYGGGLSAGGQPSNSSIGYPGVLGKGGAGGKNNRGGGGGGSGYYGGSGGTDVSTGGGLPSGGGGGSSWAKTSGGGLAFIENTIIPKAAAGGGTNNGHGSVKITFVPAAAD